MPRKRKKVSRAEVPNTEALPVVAHPPALASLLSVYKAEGGVLRYPLVNATGVDAEASHRRAACTAINADSSNATAERISIQKFVGRGYDFERKRLLPHSWENGSPPGSIFVTDAYAEAFENPPYSIPAGIEKLRVLFEGINRELFGGEGLSDELEIMQWSTDWASFFEPGHEWWGSFLWTIKTAHRPWMVVIAASTTD